MNNKDKLMLLYAVFAVIAIPYLYVTGTNTYNEEIKGYHEYCIAHGYTGANIWSDHIIRNDVVYNIIVGQTIDCDIGGRNRIPYNP